MELSIEVTLSFESHSSGCWIDAASPKLLGRAHAMMKHVGTAGICPLLAECCGRFADDVVERPAERAELLKPTSKQTSLRFGLWYAEETSRARTRRRCR